MDKDDALKIIDRFRVALQKCGVHPSKIILYGSYARGDWHEWSDIDLVVVSSDFEQKDFWERIDLLSKAICEVWAPIEAIAASPDEWKRGEPIICRYAREEGELVYAA